MYIDFKYLLQKYIQEHGLFGLIKLIAELTPPELAKSQIVEDIDIPAEENFAPNKIEDVDSEEKEENLVFGRSVEKIPMETVRKDSAPEAKPPKSSEEAEEKRDIANTELTKTETVPEDFGQRNSTQDLAEVNASGIYDTEHINAVQDDLYSHLDNSATTSETDSMENSESVKTRVLENNNSNYPSARTVSPGEIKY